MSAFGGIVAANRPVTAAMAEALAPVFTEVVVAPGYEPDALTTLTARKNLRVITATAPGALPFDVRPIDGGLLVQQPDPVSTDRVPWRVVTEPSPADQQWDDLEFAWIVCAAVSSNAIVLAKQCQAFGIGAGQQNRSTRPASPSTAPVTASPEACAPATPSSRSVTASTRSLPPA